jgi:hypothetical protein
MHKVQRLLPHVHALCSVPWQVSCCTAALRYLRYKQCQHGHVWIRTDIVADMRLQSTMGLQLVRQVTIIFAAATSADQLC